MTVDKRDPENPGRRSTDTLAAELDMFIAKTERRMRNIFIGALVSLSVIAITTAVALFGLGVVSRYNHEQAQKIEDLAHRADDRAQKSLFQNQLAKEKVCSQSSNRIIACQALYERLSGALSNEQRGRLACQTALYLKGPTAKKLLAENPQCKKLVTP